MPKLLRELKRYQLMARRLLALVNYPKKNADGSVDVYFAPSRPVDAANWVQTVPGKSRFTLFRLYGPLQAWFDKSWKLNDIERMN